MLINITGNFNSHGKFIYEKPNIFFDRRFGYKIGVRHLNVEFRANVNLKDNELFCVSTNLIDCSPNNGLQSLFNFAIVKNRKSIQNYKEDGVVFHSLQLFDLGDATFTIKRVFAENKSVDILNIFLQLEVCKFDAYGRLEQ